MAIEIVNGYPCKNCTDVEFAKKGVDPARPKEAEKAQDRPPAERGPAVTFGGQLQATQTAQAVEPTGAAERAQGSEYRPGSSVTLTV